MLQLVALELAFVPALVFALALRFTFVLVFVFVPFTLALPFPLSLLQAAAKASAAVAEIARIVFLLIPSPVIYLPGLAQVSRATGRDSRPSRTTTPRRFRTAAFRLETGAILTPGTRAGQGEKRFWVPVLRFWALAIVRSQQFPSLMR